MKNYIRSAEVSVAIFKWKRRRTYKMTTREYDDLVRFFHMEGYGWRKAQEKVDERIERLGL